ncbi:MAG: Ni,Fe-hydrogenase III large subunit [Comamonadaceae bacterium CG_4_9_14_3_um_filter_60_33]|nr:MAG: hydrogenase [Comamonadaceae bacterium CG2_30_59_20]PIY30063.1 MAG: Ni,Fe-hydrogenase III large subunit [Comamonadaceae bacterium CG_4_10_14_3_um_filter_60_42]PJB41748.1 MAG: Ni,Fe-hydrogenase III large subunit [Comamonadaceae bacterium CG_4_9_14_3_um_filter_60_33]
MRIPGLDLEFEALPAPVPIWYAQVIPEQWEAAAIAVREEGGRLLALWAGPVGQADNSQADNGQVPPPSMCAAYVTLEGAFWLSLPLAPLAQIGRPLVYPDLAGVFPAAARMQRAAADLSGVHALGAADLRPWLNHGAWPADHFPLQQNPDKLPPVAATELVNYPFVHVDGDGVHEIAVGPVHAGIIEPGHFRFSIVGEKVLRLEQRLGYTHKGTEQRMTQLAPLQAARLAGRVSGDSTVAYAWAYCMALESACQTTIPERAAWLRALMLERERIANHLGDLGAMGNDAAFAFGLAQFSRLREDWLRASKTVFGHRLMMDCIVPGGVNSDIDRAQRDLLMQQCDAVEPEVRTLFNIYEAHAGLQDRFMTAGRVTPALASQLGLTGLAGRASSQAWDLRCDHPFVPYNSMEVAMATHHNGDVAARVQVRFDEVFESLRLIRRMLDEMPAGDVLCPVVLPQQPTRGAGWVEGWRGELFVALELGGADQANRIQRCHLHDPSWQNWPVLEHAIMGNIVPDFPLINKSFNLSYSGQDL